MPSLAKRICQYPGCGKAYSGKGGYCQDHAKATRSASDREYNKTTRNQEAVKFYASKLWRYTRKAKLLNDPLCEQCKKDGMLNQATCVHHIDGDIYNLDEANLASLCWSCHTKIENAVRAKALE